MQGQGAAAAPVITDANFASGVMIALIKVFHLRRSRELKHDSAIYRLQNGSFDDAVLYINSMNHSVTRKGIKIIVDLSLFKKNFTHIYKHYASKSPRVTAACRHIYKNLGVHSLPLYVKKGCTAINRNDFSEFMEYLKYFDDHRDKTSIPNIGSIYDATMVIQPSSSMSASKASKKISRQQSIKRNASSLSDVDATSISTSSGESLVSKNEEWNGNPSPTKNTRWK
ncbi:MAG: hypothetical protein OEY79_03830 [Anaplasmataceae bacterium]|nr:hypothetical protein [Anaplasmataceae bacterium]